MESLQNQERIVHIHQMLFEMARGNFTKSIPLSGLDDEMETIVVLLNMVAEEMSASIFQDGYLNIHKSRAAFRQTTLILDRFFIIKDVTVDAGLFLGYVATDLLHYSLSEIVSEESWKQLQIVLGSFLEEPVVVALDFITSAQLLFSVSCTFSQFASADGVVLNVLTPIRDDSYSLDVSQNNLSQNKKSRASDAFLIQKLYDYILAHLDEPLPSLPVLSRKFGTNEHKLKEGFRHFFKTSIYQFYNDERLKRAYFMIQTTTFPLKIVSEMNGFINYPNFSKAFKKRFGFSPYALKRL